MTPRIDFTSRGVAPVTSRSKVRDMGTVLYVLGVFLLCLAWGWGFTSLIDKD